MPVSEVVAIFGKKKSMSTVSSLYHIVINTYNRCANLQLELSDELYAYLGGIIRNARSTPIIINGTRNHIHILMELHPSIALSEMMRQLKQSSSRWMTNDRRFSKFGGWGREYFAFSCSQRELPYVKVYIAAQREHHYEISFEEEIRRIAERNGQQWDDKKLT